MAEVFLCEKGQLTDPSKAALRKAGVVVVEVLDPSKCQFIRSSDLVSGDGMLYAAMQALRTVGGKYGDSKGDTQREAFANAVGELVASAWTERQVER